MSSPLSHEVNKPSIGSVQERFDFPAKLGAEGFTIKGEGDIGGQETKMITTVKSSALEPDAVKRFLFHEFQHGISQLYLAASPGLLTCQNRKNLRLQDITPQNHEV